MVAKIQMKYQGLIVLSPRLYVDIFARASHAMPDSQQSRLSLKELRLDIVLIHRHNYCLFIVCMYVGQ